MSDPNLLKKFDQAMFEVYRRAKSEAKYNATVFLGMLNDRGGLLTAKSLINANQLSDGFWALKQANKVNLTVEAVVLENAEFHILFAPEELEKARKRLLDVGYNPSIA